MAKKTILIQPANGAILNDAFQIVNENFTEVYDADITNWVAGTYLKGKRVFRNGGIWEVIVATTAEEPTIGTSWELKTLFPRDTNSLMDASEMGFVSKAKNLFNQEDVIDDKKISSLGVISDKVNQVISNYIRVKADTDYVRNIDGVVCYYNHSKVFITGLSSGLNFKTSKETAYIRVTFSKNNSFIAQLEQGMVSTVYEGYGYDFLNENKPKDNINWWESKFIEVGKNKLNYRTALQGFRINSKGEVEVNANASLSDYIPVDEGKNYKLSSTPSNIAIYDSAKNFLSVSKTLDSFIVPPSGRYFRTHFGTNSIQYYQVEEGTVTTVFEPYVERLKFGGNEGGGISGAEILPQYALDQINGAKVKIATLNKQFNRFNFAFCTDNHVNLPFNNLRSEMALVKMANDRLLDCVVMGGDMHDAIGTSFSVAIESIGKLTRVIGESNIPVYFTIGNHDRNDKLTPGNELSLFQMHKLYNINWASDAIYDPVNKLRGYYYVDFPDYNIRLGVINCQDKDDGAEFFISPGQLDFIANEMLNFSSKTEGNDWHIIMSIHFYNEALTPLINAFKTAGGNFIGIIGGHVHSDTQDYSRGFWWITSDCSLNSSYNSDLQMDVCFEVLTVDKMNRKLYATRVGRGPDREWVY